MAWRLHRSLILWAGIVVMISLGWAWWDSTRNAAVMGGSGFSAVSAGSGLSFQRWPGSGLDLRFEYTPLIDQIESLGDVGLRWPIYFQTSGPEGVTRIMDESARDPLWPLLVETAIGPPGSWVLYLPYWLLLMLAMLSWGSLLGWRWRRIRRAGMAMKEGSAG